MENTKKIRNKKINYRLVIRIELLILVACFVIEMFQLVNISPSLKETITLATAVKPETFTELYFENHNKLPKTIEGNKENSFVFTVHNVEYKDVEYSYVVYLEMDNQKIILDLGNFNLKDKKFRSIKEDFGPLSKRRGKVVVDLINKNQQIDFWIGEESGRK